MLRFSEILRRFGRDALSLCDMKETMKETMNEIMNDFINLKRKNEDVYFTLLWTH